MMEDISGSKIEGISVPDSYVDLDILLSPDNLLATQPRSVGVAHTLYTPTDKPSKHYTYLHYRLINNSRYTYPD